MREKTLVVTNIVHVNGWEPVVYMPFTTTVYLPFTTQPFTTHVNGWYSLLHELHESKLPFVSRITHRIYLI